MPTSFSVPPPAWRTSPAWTAESDVPAASFGAVVSTAGDVNGDGYSDVIVGASGYGNGQSNEGRAYVYLGSASGLGAVPAWAVESNAPFDAFGSSVATAGDVNGDGFSDVVVGAPVGDDGQMDEGRAFVFLGSGSGLATLPAWTAGGDQAGAGFGSSVATAGDVDGDGYADVLIGADGYDDGQANEGRTFVFLGSANGLATTPAWTAEPDQAGASFGGSVQTAGDVNGDGYSDVVVGARLHDNGQTDEGRASVYLGSSSGLATTPAWTARGGQANADFGSSVATAGDVNGDGYADVLVGAGAFDNGQTDEGRAFVYLGGASGLAIAPAWAAGSGQAGAWFGFAVAAAGDVNGDGYSDVLVGSPFYDSGQADEGGAFLYLGSSGGLATSPAWTAESKQEFATFGVAVATAGDVNGDGYADVVVGSSYYDGGQTDEGRAYVYLGSSGGLATTPSWIAESDQAFAYFGNAVATAGDVNGDGYSDVLVGAEAYDNGQADEGRVYAYLGSASGLATTAAWIAESNQASASFGHSVATAGDVNGDGYSDVLVGAWAYDNGQADEGRAYAYLGSASGLATTVAWTAEGDQTSAYFGGSVATAGDVNGDGYSDLVVGASLYDHPQFDEGRVFVFLGSTSGPGTTPAWTAESDQAFAGFGISVSTAGDVNGDGYSDVLIGASAFQNGQNGEGRAFAFLGSASGLAAVPAWTAESDQAFASFGNSVASAGDVNGDGYADVSIGAPHHDGSQADEGRAVVYYGNDGDGLERTPRQARADGTAPIHLLGRSDSDGSFVVRALGRTPAGRGRVRLATEVKPLGTPFDGTGVATSSTVDTGPSGASGSVASLVEPVGGLTKATFYRWRSRIETSDPYFPRSPWMTLAGNGATETKLRTSGCLDRDGDGYGGSDDPSCLSLVSDCEDGDPTVWGTPGPVLRLRFTGKHELAWDLPAEPGGSALLHDLLRSGIASDFLLAVCVESDGPDRTATDAAVPAAGQVFFYLTRAQNACSQGAGALGTDSSGNPRAGRSCP